MTEIALQTSHELAYPTDPTGGRLVAWASAASAANQLAKALTTTAFAPAAFRGNVGDATAAILMGDELGLSPLAALRSIYVVHGTPAMYARTMVALAQSHGHELWTELSTDAKVIVCGRRRGSDKVERSEWTIARSQKAGYTSNKKYSTNPQEMLYAKAAAEVARKVAADVLAGIPHSVEDLELEDAPTTTVTRSEPAKTTVRRKQTEPAAAPEPDPEPVADPEPGDPTPDLATAAQLTRLHVLLGQAGMDRDAALADMSSYIDRDVSTSKELTKAEASSYMDWLETSIQEGDPS